MIVMMNGHRYDGPDKIGEGIRTRVSFQWIAVYRHVVGEIVDQEHLQEWLKSMDGTYEITVATLRGLLKPLDLDCDIEKDYDEAQEPDARKMISFFNASAGKLTSAPSPLKSRGKRTPPRIRPKKATPSR